MDVNRFSRRQQRLPAGSLTPKGIRFTMALMAKMLRRYQCAPISYQIILGNSLIIFVGAIGGTLITRHLTGLATDLWLILAFTSIGATASILINSKIIQVALRPLHDLSHQIVRHQAGSAQIAGERLSDPDICRLASGLNALVAELDERNRRLRHLSERAIHAHEEERKNIARSLHDDTGQALTTLIISLERLERQLPAEMTEMRSRVGAMSQLASRALNELRATISGLRPSILDDLGLAPAIRWYARQTLDSAGIKFEMHANGEIAALPPEVNITLFRIAQESINNIARHSAAEKAEIRLTQDNQEICLLIQDDGVGFDASANGKSTEGEERWGLAGIQERADLIGAALQVRSQPGQGVSLEVIAPISHTRSVHDG
jgi:two-component system sensor histidine kinase UhpB